MGEENEIKKFIVGVLVDPFLTTNQEHKDGCRFIDPIVADEIHSPPQKNGIPSSDA